METRLIGLTRKSKGDDEGTHQDQARRIHDRLARETGLSLVNRPGDEADPFYEHKVSGGKDWRLRAFGKAVEAIRAGKAEGIIVAYEDRVSREGLEAAVAIWKELGRLEAVFIACDGVDSRQEGAEFTFNLKAAVAAEQLRIYTVRSNAGRKRAVEEGVHAGRKAPLGYRFTERANGAKNVSGNIKHGPLEPDPETAHLIPAAFRARVEKRPWREIVSLLGLGSQGSAYQLLHNRVYLGEARSGDDIVKAGAHPPLVDPVLFQRVQDTFENRTQPRRGNEQALLARVLVCASCNRHMVISRKIDAYRCNHVGCPARPTIKIGLIEPAVLFEAFLWHATLNPMYADAHSAEEVERLAKELAGALEQRDEIASAEDELDALQFARAMTKASAAVVQAEARLRDAEGAGGWLGMDTDAVQRRLFGEVPRAETFLESFARLIDVSDARDFIRQMVRVRVKPAGGRKLPVGERIEVEQLRPQLAAPIEILEREEA